MKTTKIAALIIFLIVSIPFSQASIMVNSIQGQDAIPNWIRGNDIVDFSVNAELPGDPVITNQQVRFCPDGNACFISQQCTATGQNQEYLCVARRSQSASHNINYHVQLLQDDFATVVETDEHVVNVDALPPEISQLSFNPALSNDGVTTISYTVRDAGLPGSSACVGIQSIAFYANDVLGTPFQTLAPGTCLESGTLSYTSTLTDEPQRICVIATDRFAQSTTRCESYIVDRVAPGVASLRIIDPNNGNELSFISPAPTTAHIVAEIYGTDLNANSVTADFSLLTSTAGANNRQPTQIQGQDPFVARWENMNFVNFQNCQASIRVADNAGNVNPQQVTCTTQLDNTPPHFESLGTGYRTADNKPAMGVDASLDFIFEEYQSGLSNNDILVDLSQIGLGQERPVCTFDNTNQRWHCKLEHITPINQGDKQIAVMAGSKDDVGNILGTPVVIDVLADTVPPQILGQPQVSIVASAAGTPEGYATNGDGVEILVNTSDGESVIADFAEIGGDIDIGTCGSSECTVSGDVDVSGGFTAKIPIIVFDSAGNKVQTEIEIPIYGRIEGEPDFWSSGVKVSPSAIDTFAAALKAPRVYAHITFVPKNTNAEILGVVLGDVTDCSGDFVGNVNAQDMQIYSQANSNNAVLSFSLASGAFAEHITFSCPVLIQSKIGDDIVVRAEVENITITLRFFENELANPVRNLDKKINEAVEDTEWWGGVLKWLGKIVRFADKICYFKTVFTTIMGSVDATLKAVTVTGNVIPILKPVSESIFQPILHLVQSPFAWFNAVVVVPFVNPFCDFMNCRLVGKAAAPDDKTKAEWSWLGGGVPWCTSLDNLLGGLNKKGEPHSDKAAEFQQALGAWSDSISVDEKKGQKRANILNVKESLIWSMACLCLPGIVYNFEKMREIDCRYALCLKEDVQQGIPISVCDEEKHYLTCNYVTGQIFNFIPYTKIIEAISQYVIEAITNPLILAGALQYAVCTDVAPESDIFFVCSVASMIELIGDAINSFMAIPDLASYTIQRISEKTYCDQLDDVLRKEKEAGAGE